jgi:predicted anti-sigma-YlaC factor YlaD
VISCDQVLAELSTFLDNEAAVSVHRDLEAHLAECRTCRVLYDSTLKTLRIVTDSRSFDLPEGLSERMIESIMKKVRRNPAD